MKEHEDIILSVYPNLSKNAVKVMVAMFDNLNQITHVLDKEYKARIGQDLVHPCDSVSPYKNYELVELECLEEVKKAYTYYVQELKFEKFVPRVCLVYTAFNLLLNVAIIRDDDHLIKLCIAHMLFGYVHYLKKDFKEFEEFNNDDYIEAFNKLHSACLLKKNKNVYQLIEYHIANIDDKIRMQSNNSLFDTSHRVLIQIEKKIYESTVKAYDKYYQKCQEVYHKKYGDMPNLGEKNE